MNKAVPILLVFLLSGIPATAVVCDLLLCVRQAAAPVQGCHEHGDQPSGDVISSATRGCTHLSDTAPFVAAGLRIANGTPAAVVPAAAAQPLDTPVPILAASTRAAPRPLTLSLALRI